MKFFIVEFTCLKHNTKQVSPLKKYYAVVAFAMLEKKVSIKLHLYYDIYLNISYSCLPVCH